MRLRLVGGSVTWTIIGLTGLAALLGVEAARTTREHREAAERVLVDYAALGAEGVATRLQGFLAGRLYAVLARINAGDLSTREALLDGLGVGTTELADSVIWAGRMDSAGASRVTRYDSIGAVEADLADSIRAAVRRLPDGAYFGLTAREGQLVVFAPYRGERDQALAFALPLSRVSAVVGQFLASDPVLPSSLTHGAPLDSGVAVTVSIDGQPLAQRGFVDSTPFRADQQLEPVYGGITVNVRLAESLAPALVIGGLPGSRLPFLIGVLTLALALALVAALQLRQKERLASLREDFVASVSHELRTPLAQIRLFAETLQLQRVRSDDERNRGLTVIEREARRLEHLVENLLHFSRAEGGTLGVTPEKVELGALTREIVAEFTPLAVKAEVSLRIEAPGSLSTRVDPSAWRLVVLNLLDNAVKYGGRGSQVTVFLKRDGDTCRLTVADEGPGVPPGDREAIWDRFWRGDGARGGGITGAGIGLATVRDLVSRHGGRCWVESAGTTGAHFVVQIPGGVS